MLNEIPDSFADDFVRFAMQQLTGGGACAFHNKLRTDPKQSLFVHGGTWCVL